MMKIWKKEIESKLGEDGIAQVLDSLFWPKENMEEMDGIVEAIAHPAVTHNLIVTWNAMYELNHPTFCTGVLMTQMDGTVIHGRNMDYLFPFSDGEKIKDLDSVTYEVTYQQNKKNLYYSVNWPGHVGIHTGMRHGAYSINLNMRLNRYKANLGAMMSGSLSHGVILRRTLHNEPDFQSAHKAIYDSKFAAPCYIIMAGARPYEGVILTLDRNGIHHTKTPGIQRLNRIKWHLQQTNDDENSKALDIRRPLMEHEMTHYYKQASVDEQMVLKFVRLPPTFNFATKFTVIMNPKKGEAHCFLPDEYARISKPGQTRKRTALENFGGMQRFLAPAPTAQPHVGPPVGKISKVEALAALQDPTA